MKKQLWFALVQLGVVKMKSLLSTEVHSILSSQTFQGWSDVLSKFGTEQGVLLWRGCR